MLEPEFGTVLARAKREGSTLGAVLREAWSGKALSVMNRVSTRASSSHIGIIGHITPKEFREKLAASEMAGGTFNRFLPIYVERSKRLPIPEGIDASTLSALALRLQVAVDAAGLRGGVELDEAAARLWSDELYDEFSDCDDEDAAWTEFTRRAAPYCRRIAALLAVLDDRGLVGTGDLTAAAALIRYAIGSAKYVLDRTIRNPRVDRLRRALDGAGEDGLSRRDISALFSRNLSRAVLTELIDALMETGDYEETRDVDTGGRPAHRYRRLFPLAVGSPVLPS
ncbi:MAG TPA: DUF3987 domain-containing protein [Pseudonocardiaceae bacterium]|nr:DUF3987 domain-containing protein [Pseudonocardiaceae bacterium]